MLPFDHAVISVMDDLDGAAALYSRLGFTLTPRGHHTVGSINHTMVFSGNYLELLGSAPGEREKRAEMWAYPRGLTGLSLRTAKAAQLYGDMRAAGIPLEELRHISRPVEIDGVIAHVGASTFQIDRRETGNGRIFVCQHDTPELIWLKGFDNHANGVTGIAAATMIADDPAHLLGLLSSVPGLKAGADSVECAGSTTLRVMTPAAAARAFADDGDLPGLAGKPMRMVALDLRCPSLDRVATVLSASDVPFRRDGACVSVAADTAYGLILRFVAA